MVETVEQKPVKKLTLEEKLNVNYCIPTWLRDEQIKVNCKTIKGRIEAQYELRDDPIAVVNFGPSLNDTWEEIKKFKYIITCSGAHKFLLERGVVPTYHIDVDPRAHKVKLLGQPHKDVEYLIASTCHPEMFEQLKGFNVKLWHIFDASEDGSRLLPPGEWAITGGCSAGLRCMSIARFLGFTNLHIFGMDGCESDKFGKHAAEHPNQPKGFQELEYDGVKYKTTPAMLEAAKQTLHELTVLKDVQYTFYGEGLVQHMVRNFKRPEIKKEVTLGVHKQELISKEYRELNEKLHESRLDFGVGGGKHAEGVIKLVKVLQKSTEFVRVLDYGCGKGYLAKNLPFPIDEYDPAIPGKTDTPRAADLVCCFDVLEHVEPDKLNFVLTDLRRCVRQMGYFTIALVTSGKTLADGRNAHLIVQPREWWEAQLSLFFTIAKVINKGAIMSVLVGPKVG